MISIIVPIYNAEQYLQACVHSILAQTVSEFELILVDDGSTDKSLSIAREIAKDDPRILLLTQAHAGQSAARNNGLTHAKGEYIAFVDADDSIAPDWCEQHLKAIEHVDYVQSGYKRVENEHVTCGKKPRHVYQFTSPWSRLYRRKALENIRFTEGMIYEDVIWSVDLWLSNASCRIINYCGYHYTLNPHSTTSRPNKEAQRKVLSELKKRLRSAGGKGKMIVLYTIIRLKLYFMKQ